MSPSNATVTISPTLWSLSTRLFALHLHQHQNQQQHSTAPYQHQHQHQHQCRDSTTMSSQYFCCGPGEPCLRTTAMALSVGWTAAMIWCVVSVIALLLRWPLLTRPRGACGRASGWLAACCKGMSLRCRSRSRCVPSVSPVAARWLARFDLSSASSRRTRAQGYQKSRIPALATIQPPLVCVVADRIFLLLLCRACDVVVVRCFRGGDLGFAHAPPM